MKSISLDGVERFLQRLEQNEKVIFRDYPDHLLLPIVPFFQLVHLGNLETVIEMILQFEIMTKGMFIRVDGFLTFTIVEQDYLEDEVRHFAINLFENMRF
ncbi:hypothetical protein Sps_02501 [Shewanella psychrophila]|uniref:Uncharacterized protein n=1 Tax=Shewanella psychrophila TaxID=225848 RepID=A0A1S6HQ48_9GAMM|nr:hypothetical protein [Shewanella psychrophila]AQS37655.1 hypothetical protein Sps_02501 [Shewanella psychrophila]